MGLTDSSKVLGESVWAGTTPEGDYELDVFVEYSKYCYIKLKESINIYYREENGNHFIHYPPFDIWVSSGSKDGAYRKFAEKMLEFAALDEDKKQRLRHQVVAKSLEYSPNTVIQKWIDLFNQSK